MKKCTGVPTVVKCISASRFTSRTCNLTMRFKDAFPGRVAGHVDMHLGLPSRYSGSRLTWIKFAKLGAVCRKVADPGVRIEQECHSIASQISYVAPRPGGQEVPRPAVTALLRVVRLYQHGVDKGCRQTNGPPKGRPPQGSFFPGGPGALR